MTFIKAIVGFFFKYFGYLMLQCLQTVQTTRRYYIVYVQSKKEGKDQESIQSSTTTDPGYQWENDDFTIRLHKREPRGQPFPSW